MIRIDCTQYRGDRPCAPHKRDGRTCDACDEYRTTVDRVLLIKLGAAGDVLRTTALLPALHRRWEQPHITWLTRSSAARLLEGNPWIARVLTLEEPYLELLLRERFTAGICLDAEAQPASLLALTRCEHRFGFIADERGRVVPANDLATTWWLMGVDDGKKRGNRQSYPTLMYEVCDLLPPVERPFIAIDPELARAAASHFAGLGVPPSATIIGLNTGGGSRWQHKKWTTAGWIDLAHLLSRRLPDAALVLLGGPEERELNATLVQACPDLIDGGCGHDLRMFAALIDRLDVLVTSDSLALHMATARAVPAVALVGPTSPWELDLYGMGEVLTGDVNCIACYLTRCDKAPSCMDRLSPARVADAVGRWVNQRARLQEAV